MGRGDTFGFFEYDSDNGNSYAIKLSADVAVQGGFGTVANPLAIPGYPFGPKNLRHVWGRAASGQRARLPIKNAGDSLFQSGGTFTLGGTPYTVEGAIGEARKLNNLGG